MFLKTQLQVAEAPRIIKQNLFVNIKLSYLHKSIIIMCSYIHYDYIQYNVFLISEFCLICVLMTNNSLF